eukprot:7901757-Lingulodinium_polyedra.AAC.1
MCSGEAAQRAVERVVVQCLAKAAQRCVQMRSAFLLCCAVGARTYTTRVRRGARVVHARVECVAEKR